MSPACERFWQQCRATVPGIDPAARCRARHFGDDPAIARRVLELILAGEKTGTFAVDWEYDARPGERPRPGDCYVVTDFAGEPGVVVRLTSVATMPFEDITELEIQCEGPALRAIGPWRRVHWDYWSRTLADIGRQPARDMPVLVQRFGRIYPPA